MSILKKLNKSDIKALEKVYRQHFGKVHNVVIKYINDKSLAEDITQDVFIRLWNNRAKIALELPIEQQLFTITKNLVINNLKKRANEYKHIKQYYYENSTISFKEDENEDIEQLKIINKLILELPKKQQKVLKMHRFQGLTYDEIANVLNISKNTVSSHLSAAMLYLKKNITAIFFF